MILLLDNYDSFVHNVARYLRLAGKETRVIRSDSVTAAECFRMQPEAIILSPGPKRPEHAGCCVDVVKHLAGEIPILGICLGHQAITTAYGGQVDICPPAHATASVIEHDNSGVFSGLPQSMTVGRYHSLCVSRATLPESLAVNAWLPVESLAVDSSPGWDDSMVMGISDHARCVHGVQFHPESLLTENGTGLIENFFNLADHHHARLHRARIHHGHDSHHGMEPQLGTRCPVGWMSPVDHCSAELFSDRGAGR